MLYVSGLAKQYRPGRGVMDIEFELPDGECLAVLGRNGSGKSTLTRLLLGLEIPDRGELCFMGHRHKRGVFATGRRDLQRRVSSVLDSSAHWDTLSGWENAYFFARSYGLIRERINESLSELFARADLLHRAHDSVGGYSFGMRRKLSIIQALSVEPELLILDEPTIGLDAAYMLILSEQIRRRGEKGQATLITGNCPEMMEEVADRVAFLEDGRIAALAPVAEHLRKVRRAQELRLELESSRRLDPAVLPRVEGFEQKGNSVVLVADSDPLVVPRIMEAVIRQGCQIASLEVHRARLRDAFLLETGRGLDSDGQMGRSR